jgi:hypothetical protein
MPVTLELRRLRQEDHDFETNLSYIARPCLKQQSQKVKGWRKIHDAYTNQKQWL